MPGLFNRKRKNNANMGVSKMPDITLTSRMSATELAECRENLKRYWETQQVDETLLRRAWEAAHRIAAALYQEYDAAKVAVFGSLTERHLFTKHSDIDIVVWGLSSDKCLDALWETEGLNGGFKIDIIDFEETSELFRRRVLNQAVPIDSAQMDILKFINEIQTSPTTGEIYDMHRDKLTQRIDDERTKIEKTVQRIERALEKINVLPDEAREFIERALAADLAEVYSGIERIFERIAREVDNHIPSGAEWHKDLLTQMAERRPERPPIISPVTQRRLKRLLKFRHKVNNIYGDELIYEHSAKHAKRVRKLFDNVSKELETFADFLYQK